MARKTVRRIKQYLADGDFRYSLHCVRTAEDRIVTNEDIRSVGRTAFTAKHQANGSYKIVGNDSQSMELTVICRLSMRAGVLIITVF